MRVLVVGGGGREHALCWALQRDAPSTTLFAAPGNPGTAQLATNLPITATAVDDLVRAAAEHRIDCVIVGPEAPLAAGLADRLRAAGRPVFGPNAGAARLESSKSFAKEVMAAAGKGAVVCDTRAAAAAAARRMLADGALGEAGREIVIEAFLEGEELSVLALTDGEQLAILPPAQDHKRLGEGDTGPNTGGMGAYTPVSLTTPALLDRVRREILEPTLREMARRGAPYQGVLYAGLMVAPDGAPSVVEFNCRFGDPEAQAILPVLPPRAIQAVLDIAAGAWPSSPSIIAPTGAAVTTVLAAPGYPDAPQSGAAITLPAPDSLGPDVMVFHAGTALDAGTLRVKGGRVFAVTGTGPDVARAAARSRAACERVAFAGKTWRRDVAWRELARAGAA